MWEWLSDPQMQTTLKLAGAGIAALAMGGRS
jgi:hypothetical protein